MVLSWLRRLLAPDREPRPATATGLPGIDGLPFYRRLPDEEQARLRSLTRHLVDDKSWEGCGGLELKEEMQVVIAAQAARLILNLDHAYYRKVRTILVYPSGYRTPDGEGRLGEAWHRGPVILAWDSAFAGGRNPRDGRNLVYHEFAHKLDLLDGYADGAPPLGGGAQHEAWRRITSREYEELVRRAERRRKSFLNPYGATNPAEFFAVATEHFFEQPRKMIRKHRALYRELQSFYRQHPAARARRRRKATCRRRVSSTSGRQTRAVRRCRIRSGHRPFERLYR